MSIGGLILAIGFTISIVALIFWPILIGYKSSKNYAKGDLSSLAVLRAEREAILIAVRDLDFDHQMGKYAEEDYQSQRESLMQRGAYILKQIDEYESAAIEEAVRVHRSA